MYKSNTETFKNPINLARPLTVDPTRRFERYTHRDATTKERRPKTSGKETRRDQTGEFQSSSTSTTFSFASDEDYDTDLEDNLGQNRDHSCIGIYKRVCKQEQIVPVTSYIKHYDQKELSLHFYGLGPRGMRAFIPSLTMNQYITKLDLSNNGLGDEGIIYLSHILRDNIAIVDVDISQNFITIHGARALCDMFKDNITINHLKLEGNLLNDECARLFGELISSTGQLNTINLARNKFESASGFFFGSALAENTTMHSLDLSWNAISGKGAIALIKGIQKNVFLKILNLAHNGFSGVECGRAWLRAFKENTTLIELDLSCNHLTTEPAIMIGRGMTKSESLEIIRLTGNPLESAGCYALLKPLISKKAMKNKLKLIDITEILFNRDFRQLYIQITSQRPELRILIGLRAPPVLLKDGQLSLPSPVERLRTLIQRRPNLDALDFFLSAASSNGDDKLEGRVVDHGKLKQAIEEKLGGQFSDNDIDEIIKEVDQFDYKKFQQVFESKPATASLSSSSWHIKT